MLATPSAPRVWVDDSHPIYRRGLAACLRAEGFQVVGDSAQLLPTPSLAELDVLVFEATRVMLRQVVALAGGTAAALVALVDTAEDDLVAGVVEAGVAAVLLRSQLTPASLGGALRGVTAGNASLPVSSLGWLLERAAHGARHGSAGLTSRELDVLRLLADGEDTRDIADSLSYSERTVKNVVHDVLVKMNCRNRAHAVALATRQGVI